MTEADTRSTKEPDNSLHCSECTEAIPPDISTGITTLNYWDCECSFNYIHPKVHRACQTCGAREEEQPDAHIAEVTRYIAHPLCRNCQYIHLNTRVTSGYAQDIADQVEDDGYTVEQASAYGEHPGTFIVAMRCRKADGPWEWLSPAGWISQYGEHPAYREGSVNA